MSSLVDKLFFKLVVAYYWLRVAASPLLLGAVLALGVYYLLPSPVGIGLGAGLVVVGAVVGVRFANRAHRKRNLIELAEAIPPDSNEQIQPD